MSDSMEPARAAHLQRLGLPATYEGAETDEHSEFDEAQDAVAPLPPSALPPLPRTPTRKENPTALKSPKSPGSAKKSVSFLSSVDSPKLVSTAPAGPTPRNNERKLKGLATCINLNPSK